MGWVFPNCEADFSSSESVKRPNTRRPGGKIQFTGVPE
jgi:hypothetical protein